MSELKNSAGQIISKDIATVFEQTQVAYTTLSTNPSQACANCIFFRDTDYDGIGYQHCAIVEAYPDPILPTGICNHWEAKPVTSASELVEELAEAVTDVVEGAVDAMVAMMPTVTMEMAAKPKSLLQRAKETLFPAKEESAFNVFKGNDGKWYWIAKYTNAYQDKEGEIFTEKSHEEFIRRVDMGLVDKPELWTWHTKGSKHGQADTVFGVGRIMVAIGHFDETKEAQTAIKYYQKNADKIKLSHGALAPKWAIHDGLIESYNTFEISTLPIGSEANPYTSYEAIKSMQPDSKKLDWVATVLGKEKAEAIVKDTAEYSKSLDDMQVRYKDFAQVSPPDTAPTTEVQKSMGEAFIEMVKDQGEFVSLLKAMENRQNATDELVKSLTKRAEAAETAEVELRKIVNAGPRRPSEDGNTQVTDQAELAKAQAALPNNEADDFKSRWGVPMKTNGNGSTS